MKTFTQLVGTTSQTSQIDYPTSFSSLAKNNSEQGVAIGASLINDQHRYLIQRYFDNERTAISSTVGSSSLTLTGSLAIGDISATLSSVWTHQTCQQYVNFSSSEQRLVNFTYNSVSITWTVPLTVIATSSIKALGIQDYPIPADVSKIKNNTIKIGQMQFQPRFLQTRGEWDAVNFLPYNSDIPNYCFIYNGKLGIFPIPSTTGNAITFNYKARVPDLTFADYDSGTIAGGGATAGSTSITGLSTSWGSIGKFPLNTDLTFYNLYLRIDPPYGDGVWYQIERFNSDTSLTLVLPIVSAPNITASSTYTIGQMPVLSEDFHDMIVLGALKVYYSTFVPDEQRFGEVDAQYKERMELLKDYAGTKSVNVDLGAEPSQVNPNLFLYGN